MNISVFPLEGIEVNRQSIRLGDEKSLLTSCLGNPDATHENRYYYFGSELAFDCDNSGKIEFIEFLGGREGKIQPIIYGYSAFSVKADELLEILSRENNGTVKENEGGYGYVFSDIEVGIYRDLLPEEVELMRKQTEENGEAINEEKLMYELSKAMYWATIGIGRRGYFD